MPREDTMFGAIPMPTPQDWLDPLGTSSQPPVHTNAAVEVNLLKILSLFLFPYML